MIIFLLLVYISFVVARTQAQPLGSAWQSGAKTAYLYSRHCLVFVSLYLVHSTIILKDNTPARPCQHVFQARGKKKKNTTTTAICVENLCKSHVLCARRRKEKP